MFYTALSKTRYQFIKQRGPTIITNQRVQECALAKLPRRLPRPRAWDATKHLHAASWTSFLTNNYKSTTHIYHSTHLQRTRVKIRCTNFSKPKRAWGGVAQRPTRILWARRWSSAVSRPPPAAPLARPRAPRRLLPTQPPPAVQLTWHTRLSGTMTSRSQSQQILVSSRYTSTYICTRIRMAHMLASGTASFGVYSRYWHSISSV